MGADSANYELAADGSFVAPFDVSYPYSRTVGPVLDRFFRGLGEQRIEGTVGSDGRVFTPPAEFDPLTGERCTEWVVVADRGEVLTWALRPGEPVGWGLVRLDGSDVPMLHKISASQGLATGMRVQAQWSEQSEPSIHAIEMFVPETDSVASSR